MGRIGYFLETLPLLPMAPVSIDELRAARKRVAALEKLFDRQNTAERLTSILN